MKQSVESVLEILLDKLVEAAKSKDYEGVRELANAVHTLSVTRFR